VGMYYNALPISTLYLKVNFKRTPYKNDVISLRIVANTYSEFTANKALYIIDNNPDNINLTEVNNIIETLRIKANALSVNIKMPKPVYKKLLSREII
jgi:hypothetical protein